MSSFLIGSFGILIMFVFILLRQPIWLSLLICGVVGNFILNSFSMSMFVTSTSFFDVSSGYGLSVIPLFILMGEIASKSKMSRNLFNSARIFMSGLKGALSMSSIVASGAFGAISGSSIATAASMTRIAYPEMSRAGYEEGYSAASIAAGGTLGILIPPSIILVIYAYLTEQSVQKLFFAALIPGLIAVVLYMIAIRVYLLIYPDQGGYGTKMPLKERIAAVWKVFPIFLIFAIIMGGLYLGFFTATESAAVGVILVMIFVFLRRQLTLEMLKNSVWDTIKTVGALYLIVVGAAVFNVLITVTQLPFTVVDFINDLQLSPLGIILVICAIYLVLGTVMDSLAMLFLTIPVFYPVIADAGIDPIWFGIFAVIVVEFGLISPPVGMNLFVIKGVMQRTPLQTIWFGTVPFLLTDMIRLALIIAFPAICLYLPSLMMG